MGWTKLWRAAIAATALSVSGAAEATWYRATSPHFVVYSQDDADDLRALTGDLERLDGFVRLFQGLPDKGEAQSNKLTVYVAPSVAAVQKLCGKCPNVYGFYQSRASGSVAFTPRRSGSGSVIDLGPQTVLFHEYAHHFMLGNYAQAYPAWFSEGYAEMFSTFKVEKDRLVVGNAPAHRAYSLLIDRPMPARQLFDPSSRRSLSDDQIGQLYARGWLLTHYIMLNVDRRRQMSTYLGLLNSGTPSVAAATTAFGDLSALDAALNRYRDRSRIPGVTVPVDKVTVPPIDVVALPAGQQAMLPLRMRSTRGVNGTTAVPLYREAAPVATAYPDDAVVQGWFAEMAFDAGEDAAAAAAAERALAIDPKSVQALLYKANVQLRAAAKAKDAAGFAAARRTIIRANRLDANVAEPLVTYYRSFAMARETPSKSAIAALYRAQELVPQDPSVRLMAVRQSLLDNDLDGAKRYLRPLAYSPHGGADNPAAKLLALLDAGGGRDAALKEGAVAEEPEGE